MKWLVYIVNPGCSSSSGINSAASALLPFHHLISQSVAELCLMFATLRDCTAAAGEDASTHRLSPPVQLWDVTAKRAFHGTTDAAALGFFFPSFSTSEAGWPWVDLIPDLRNYASRRSILWLKCVQFNLTSSGDDLWLLFGPCLFPFHDIFNVTLLISESNLKCCFDMRQEGLSVITIDIILHLYQFIFSPNKTLTLLWLVSIHPQLLLFHWNHIRWWSY